MNDRDVLQGLVYIGVLGLVSWIIWLGMQRSANGHPPEDCPKVEQQVKSKASVKSQDELRKEHIETFQRVNGLKIDGLIGPETAKECHYYCFGFYN